MVLPLITSATHNSINFDKFAGRIALDSWHINEFSDIYTADTAYNRDALGNIVAKVNRAIGIYNRPREFSSFFEKDFLGNLIWKDGQELTNDEKEFCMHNFYDPYYKEIEQLINLSKEKGFDKVILWDQHDTGDFDPVTQKRDRKLPGQDRTMPKFILSNFGLPAIGKVDPENKYASCPAEFIQNVRSFIADEFDLKLEEVEINTHYKGGNIIQHFTNPKNDFGNNVWAIQVEYNRGLIMDQATRKPYWDTIKEFNGKFNTVMEKACGII